MDQQTTPQAERGKVLPFPAVTCAFYLRDGCTLARTIRRDAAEGARCRVLSLWERLQDEALDIAEEQSLDEAAAMAVMAEHMRRVQDLDLLCPRYRPGGEDAALDCIFFHGHLCILALPCCHGPCPEYQPRSARTYQQQSDEPQDPSICPPLLHLF